jgi:hypothetical protein
MAQTQYVCTGSCGAEVTEEEFLNGKTTCTDETCDQYGEPLEKMMYCAACDEYFTQESEHAACD